MDAPTNTVSILPRSWYPALSGTQGLCVISDELLLGQYTQNTCALGANNAGFAGFIKRGSAWNCPSFNGGPSSGASPGNVTCNYFPLEQNQFYAKFVKAVRDAGYQGPLIGSPWQAPAMVPHYYNLYSDYLAGYIDRHNFAGGQVNYAMLNHPGSGMLSTRLQQVVDRPFGLSEWIHVYPSLYSAEGSVIMAAYGMGLQGWDASYQYQSHAEAFQPQVGKFPFGIWECDVPSQIGQYPTLAINWAMSKRTT